jgi:hypothetical protein
MRRSFLFPLISILFLFSAFCQAQNWSGVISSGRAIDWSTSGIPGGIPTRNTVCTTISAYGGSGATISNAIASCPAGEVVMLGAGTFNLSSGFQFHGANNVTVRGQGANSTLLVFTGAGAGFYGSVVSMEPSSLNEGNDSEQNVCDWTAGYAPGATVITVANCGSSTPAIGSLSNLHVGSILMLDQLDEYNDTGTIWNCLAGQSEGGPQCANNPVGSGGEARHDGACTSSPTECYRSQQQGVIVTGINGNQITISPGLYMPNWRSGQLPQAEFATAPIVGDGIEDMSIDATSAGAGQNILVGNCDQCYVLGVRSIDANRSHIREMYSTRFEFISNYTYQNQSHNTVSYGIEMFGGWDGIIANNIMQQNSDSEPSCSGACEGNVIAYNFDTDNTYNSSGWMQAGSYLHASGTAYNLWEGNIGPGYDADDVHGTHFADTLFRNYNVGNQNAGCGSAGTNTCTAQTVPIQLAAGDRYVNLIGNVSGQIGFHNKYQCVATSTSDCPGGGSTIYNLGFTGNTGSGNANPSSSVNGFCTSPSCSAHSDYDPQVSAYLMRWGNWDVVTNATRWCGTGSETNCGGVSEIPTSLPTCTFCSGTPTLSNAIPSGEILPNSFYLTATSATSCGTGISFWKNPTTGTCPQFPPVGPDVSNGAVGQCSGGTYNKAFAISSATLGCSTGGGTQPASFAGHVDSIPALTCFLAVMGGPPDGTGSLRSFNRASCYADDASSDPPPAAPTGLAAQVSP